MDIMICLMFALAGVGLVWMGIALLLVEDESPES